MVLFALRQIEEGLTEDEKLEKLEQFFEKSDFNIKGTDKLGRTLLHYAARLNLPKIGERLISQKVAINIKDNNGENTPLQLAVYGDSLEMGKLLIFHGADINETNSDG